MLPINQSYSSSNCNKSLSAQPLPSPIDQQADQNEPFPLVESPKAEAIDSHKEIKAFYSFPAEINFLILENFRWSDFYAFLQVSRHCLEIFYQYLCSRFRIDVSKEDSAAKKASEINNFLNENKNIVKYALCSDQAHWKAPPHIQIFHFFIHHIFFKSPLLKRSPLLFLRWIIKNEGSYRLTPRKCIEMGLFPQKEITIALDEKFSKRQSDFIIEQSLPIFSQKSEASIDHFIKIPKDELKKGIVKAFSTPGGEQIATDMLDSNMFRVAHRLAREKQENPAIWFFNKAIDRNSTELERKRWKEWLRKCIASGIRVGHYEEDQSLSIAFGISAGPEKEDQSLIYDAIDKGNEDKELIELALRTGADPNQTGSSGELPLRLAIKRNYSLEIINLLIKYGANPKPRHYYGRSVLYALFEKERSDFFQKPSQLTCTSNVSPADIAFGTESGEEYKETSSYQLITKKLAIAKALFPQGGLYDEETGNTALSVVLQNYHDNPEIIRAVLEYGEKPDQLVPCRYGSAKQFSALSMLCEEKWNGSDENIIKIAKLLIEYGANIYTENFHGTLLHQIIYASDFFGSEFNSELFSFFIQNGLNPNTKNRNGDPPLLYAIKQAKIYHIEFLLKNGADATLTDSNNDTALDLLLSKNFTHADQIVNIINFLFDHGAKLEHLKTQTWFRLFTAPTYFERHDVDNCKELFKIIKALVEKGFNLNVTDNAKQQSALHLAVQNKKFTGEFIKDLLQLGARADLKDRYGATPYTLASHKKREVLIACGIYI